MGEKSTARGACPTAGASRGLEPPARARQEETRPTRLGSAQHAAPLSVPSGASPPASSPTDPRASLYSATRQRFLTRLATFTGAGWNRGRTRTMPWNDTRPWRKDPATRFRSEPDPAVLARLHDAHCHPSDDDNLTPSVLRRVQTGHIVRAPARVLAPVDDGCSALPRSTLAELWPSLRSAP